MTIMRIVLVGATIVVLMVVAQDRNWPQKMGVVGVCAPVGAPSSAPTGSWYSCKQGLVNGFPALEADGCASIAIVEHREIWQCDRPLASLPGA